MPLLGTCYVFAANGGFNDIYGNNASIGANGNEACEIDPSNPACNSDDDGFGIATSIINVLSVTVGVVATIVIIVAGITISSSAGDAGKIKKAKNAIIYAAIGLFIALSAALIVNFVLEGVFG